MTPSGHFAFTLYIDVYSKMIYFQGSETNANLTFLVKMSIDRKRIVSYILMVQCHVQSIVLIFFYLIGITIAARTRAIIIKG